MNETAYKFEVGDILCIKHPNDVDPIGNVFTWYCIEVILEKLEDEQGRPLYKVLSLMDGMNGIDDWDGNFSTVSEDGLLNFIAHGELVEKDLELLVTQSSPLTIVQHFLKKKVDSALDKRMALAQASMNEVKATVKMVNKLKQNIIEE